MDEGVRRLDANRLGDHVDRLYRAAWALCGNREDAEDLVQETYARVLARPRFVRHDDDLGYLVRALRNAYVSRRRAADRRPRLVAMEAAGEPGDDRPQARPERAIEVDELFGAIAGLPDLYREALVAVDVAGLSYAEAARALRTREATITSRLHRARSRVAKILSAEGATA